MSPTPSAAGRPEGRTPGIVISALTFALLGFACALPAVVGLILGLIGRPRAKEAGVGVGLANAAIAISVAWLVVFLILVMIAAASTHP